MGEIITKISKKPTEKIEEIPLQDLTHKLTIKQKSAPVEENLQTGRSIRWFSQIPDFKNQINTEPSTSGFVPRSTSKQTIDTDLDYQVKGGSSKSRRFHFGHWKSLNFNKIGERLSQVFKRLGQNNEKETPSIKKCSFERKNAFKRKTKRQTSVDRITLSTPPEQKTDLDKLTEGDLTTGRGNPSFCTCSEFMKKRTEKVEEIPLQDLTQSVTKNEESAPMKENLQTGQLNRWVYQNPGSNSQIDTEPSTSGFVPQTTSEQSLSTDLDHLLEGDSLKTRGSNVWYWDSPNFKKIREMLLRILKKRTQNNDEKDPLSHNYRPLRRRNAIKIKTKKQTSVVPRACLKQKTDISLQKNDDHPETSENDNKTIKDNNIIHIICSSSKALKQ